ncbi:MAG TPA: class II aldolase/adducin family protein [Pseudonocardiaceae bacterium]|nr:class II aldolase/adducin family protein [Pseudonocardiaceae bacterium]
MPGADGHLLINPYGLTYREVTASNLVKIDLDGNIVGPSEWPVNAAGLVIHTAIHSARPDSHCVMHTHTSATAWTGTTSTPRRSTRRWPTTSSRASPSTRTRSPG